MLCLEKQFESINIPVFYFLCQIMHRQNFIPKVYKKTEPGNYYRLRFIRLGCFRLPDCSQEHRPESSSSHAGS